MRHVLLALPLLAACSSESPSQPDGGVVVLGCYVPPDGGIFVNGLPSPIPGCTTAPGPTGTLDFTTIGWPGFGVLFVPPTAAPGTPLPAVFVFHGSGGTGEDIRERFGLEGPADGGAIFVYPDAVQQAAESARTQVPTTEEQFAAKEKELQRARAKLRMIQRHRPGESAGH